MGMKKGLLKKILALTVTVSVSMTPVFSVWAEDEVEIENESQAEEITEDGNYGMSDFAEVTDETEELPNIDLEEEETQTNGEVAMEITPEDDQNAETEEDFSDSQPEAGAYGRPTSINIKDVLAIFGMVIIMMTERSQSPVHRESGEMQKPTATARIMMH